MRAVEADSTAALLDGRYRLIECVGEGGMARVYRAEDVVLGRTVAIKLIRPGIDSASSERARSEMTVLASLNHPSLVTLFDARLVPGQPEYLAMEFVDGPTLASRLASAGALPADTVAHLASELAEALHVVHKAGIVHRDIKPSNVLLSPAQIPGARPRAKLADFGIAILVDSSRITSPGLVVGTIAYLAPEQLRGGEPAPASDIYSLGLVLLEALTGERVHPHGAGMEAALARLENSPAIPASVEPAWAELLTRMMNPSPAARPTAAEVATEARRLVDRSTRAATAGPAAATAATVPLTAETLDAPAAGPAAAAAAGAAEPALRLPIATEPTVRGRRSKRVVAAIGAALAAVAVVIATVAGIVASSGPEQQPGPGMTVPADPQPSEEQPAEEQPADDGVTEGDDGMTEEERKQQEEEQKRTEEEQKKREEEQRKQQEEEQKRIEEDQKKQDDRGDD